MTIDTAKAKRALATLQEEKRAQQDWLQLAAQAKRELEDTLRADCQILSVKERYGLRITIAPRTQPSFGRQSA